MQVLGADIKSILPTKQQSLQISVYPGLDCTCLEFQPYGQLWATGYAWKQADANWIKIKWRPFQLNWSQIEYWVPIQNFKLRKIKREKRQWNSRFEVVITRSKTNDWINIKTIENS